ncbi:histone-lysine N-methyltransferase ATXR6-like [Nymphaea colorata]|nr:histone-lysine N-methyltransferase ATXR6-like [Nymphaea colorata]
MTASSPSDCWRAVTYGGIWCQERGSGLPAAELLFCDKCGRGFRLSCRLPIVARVAYGRWFCPSCTTNKEIKEFPSSQTKIIDFFGISRPINDLKPKKETTKRRRRAAPLALRKKRRKFLPFQPTEDAHRRLEQLASLATALTTVGAEFCNQLTYLPLGVAARSANRASLEPRRIQVLHKQDAETLNLCNEMIARGECPPLMVSFDEYEGFTVVADSFIKGMTLLAEYVGDVDYLSNREYDDGDSMMTLLLAADPSKSLVICPDKRANIARFINGINNYLESSRKRQNVKCLRYDVDGECRVLLVTLRGIAKGEKLYYDYNGDEHEYPTHHFV